MKRQLKDTRTHIHMCTYTVTYSSHTHTEPASDRSWSNRKHTPPSNETPRPKTSTLNPVKPLELTLYRKYRKQRNVLMDTTGIKPAASEVWKILRHKWLGFVNQKTWSVKKIMGKHNCVLKGWRDIPTKWNLYTLLGPCLNKPTAQVNNIKANKHWLDYW